MTTPISAAQLVPDPADPLGCALVRCPHCGHTAAIDDYAPPDDPLLLDAYRWCRRCLRVVNVAAAIGED